MGSNGTRSGKVFVLGSGTRAFLTVVRSLGRKGLEVHAGSHNFDPVVLGSRYLKSVHILPPPTNPNVWMELFTDLLRDQHFELIIPTDDPTTILCRKYRSELEKHSMVYLLDEKAYQITNDKSKTHDLALSLGVNVPPSELLDDDSDLGKVSDALGFPLMLKPVSSYKEDDLVSRRYVKRVNSKEELTSIFSRMIVEGPVMAQGYFPGVGAGIEVLCHQGKILTSFEHIRVHEPRGGGVSAYRRSAPLDPELLEASRKIMEVLNYTGVCMLEFRVNERTGAWALIEINGRFWGSLPLAVVAGQDFPYYLYEMLVHKKRDFPQGYKNNIYCRNTTLDLAWAKENVRDNKMKILTDLSNVFLLRERNDTLVLDDPRPGIMELYSNTEAVYRGGLRYVQKRLIGIPLVRSIRAKRLRKVLGKAKNIIFVCKGNICRSPFAEHYARNVFPPGIDIKSYGTHKQDGRNSPAEAIASATRFGVDLRHHESDSITEEGVKKADIIFVFDWENLQKLVERFPFVRTKVHLFSEINPRSPLFIQDPYGKDLDAFNKSYEMIAHSLNTIKVG
jgi:protein-tyrosine-phosphatase/predicted ATP-grasp superfamily ATP-dependent carboligase